MFIPFVIIGLILLVAATVAVLLPESDGPTVTLESNI